MKNNKGEQRNNRPPIFGAAPQCRMTNTAAAARARLRDLRLTAAVLLLSVFGAAAEYRPAESGGESVRAVRYADYARAADAADSYEGRAGSFTIRRPASERWLKNWRAAVGDAAAARLIGDWSREAAEARLRDALRDKLLHNRAPEKLSAWWRNRADGLLRRLFENTADYGAAAFVRSLEEQAGGASFVRTIDADYRSSLGGRRWQAGVSALGALRESESDAVVWQLRGFGAEARSYGGNAGLIYRYIPQTGADAAELAGVNVFLDYEHHGKYDETFWRWSLGGEYRAAWADVYLNRYFALTDAARDGNAYVYTREGFDAALRLRAPFAPWLGGGLTYYNWRGEFGDDDDRGLRYALDISPPPLPGLKLELEYEVPESGGAEWGGAISYARRFKGAAAVSDADAASPAAAFNARDYFYTPVRREYGQRISRSADVIVNVTARATMAAGAGVVGGLPEARAATLTMAAGETEVRGVLLTLNGDALSYASTAAVTLHTGDGGTMSVSAPAPANWTVVVNEASRARFLQNGYQLNLLTGTIIAARDGGVLTRIGAPNATLRLAGTRLAAGYAGAPETGTTRVTLYEGIIDVEAASTLNLARSGGEDIYTSVDNRLVIVVPSRLSATVRGAVGAETGIVLPSRENLPARGARAAELAMLNGVLYAVGGYSASDEAVSEVWSSADGVRWTLQTAAGGFAPRAGHALVARGGRLVLLGGVDHNDNVFGDVWSSEDGINWRRDALHDAAATADFAPPPHHGAAAVLYGDSILLLGGAAEADASPVRNDVWMSADGGRTWQALALPAGAGRFAARYNHAALTRGDNIYVFGGWSGADSAAGVADVWVSADGGAGWSRVAADYAPAGRGRAAAAVYDDGGGERIYLTGGDQGAAGDLADVWSSADGENWVRERPAGGGGFEARGGHGLFVLSGRLHVVGGVGGASGLDNAWSSYDGVLWTLAPNTPARAALSLGLRRGDAAVSGRTVDVGGAATGDLTLTASATGTNGEYRYGVINDDASALSADENTGALSLDNAIGYGAAVTATVFADDGRRRASLVLVLRPPRPLRGVLSGDVLGAAREAAAGETLTLSLRIAADYQGVLATLRGADGDGAYTYAAALPAAGMTFDAGTGVLSFSSPFALNAAATATLTVTDGGGNEVKFDFRLQGARAVDLFVLSGGATGVSDGALTLTVPGSYTGVLATVTASGGSGAGFSFSLPPESAALFDLTAAGEIARVYLRDALGEGRAVTAVVGVTDISSGVSAARELIVRTPGAVTAVLLGDAADGRVDIAGDASGAVATVTATGGDGAYRYRIAASDRGGFAMEESGGAGVLRLSASLGIEQTVVLTLEVADGSDDTSDALVTLTVATAARLTLFIQGRENLEVLTRRTSANRNVDAVILPAAANAGGALATIAARGGDAPYTLSGGASAGNLLFDAASGVLRAAAPLSGGSHDEEIYQEVRARAGGDAYTLYVFVRPPLPSGAWNERLSLHAMVSLNDSLYAYGASGSINENHERSAEYRQVWSSADGHVWTRIYAGQGSSARNFVIPVYLLREHAAAAAHNGSLYLIGGDDTYTGPLSDVWASPDGVSWTRTVDNAQRNVFSQRSKHAAVSYQGALFVIGHDDAWSSDNGETWRERTTPGFDFDRNTFVKAAAADGTLFVMGYTADGAGEIWQTTNGDNWRVTSRPALLNPRRAQASFAAYGGRLYVIGGAADGGARLADVWSSADGARWLRETGGGAFAARAGHAAAAYDGRLYISGGDGAGALGVWSSYDGAAWAAAPNTPEAAAMTAVLLSAHVTTFAGVTLTTYEYGGDAGPFTLPVRAAQTGTVAYASALPGNTDVTYEINADADIAARVNGAIVLNAALGYNGTVTATVTVREDGGGDSAEFELLLVTPPPLIVRREGETTAATRYDINTPVNSAVAVLTLAVSGGDGNYQYTPSALPADVNLVTTIAGRIIVSLAGDGFADGESADFTIAISDGSGAAEGMATVTINLRGGIVALLLDARGEVIGDTLGNAPEIYTDESETAAASAESPLVLATLTASGGDGAFSYAMQGVTGLSLTLSLAGDVAVLQAIGTIPNLARNEARPNITLRISDGSGLAAALTVQFNSELPLLNWNTPIFNHVLMSANGQFLSYGDDSGTHQNELWLRGLPGEWLVLLRGGGYSARVNDAAAAHNGAFYIIGGRDSNGDLLNDVWASNGAEQWRPVLADNTAPAADQFSQREGHAAVSFGGTLLVVGHDDVWSSDDNGQTWRRRATPGFDFDAGDIVRVALRGGALYALGYTAAGEGELWQATDADSWSRVSRPGLLTPRRADMAFTALNDRLYIIGGAADGGATLADVWSSADGIRWLRETESGEFLARAGHAAGAYGNRLYVSGGKTGSADYGVWSSVDGVSWAASPDAPTAAAMTAVLLSARVTVFGGATLTTYEYGGDAGPFTLPVRAAQTGTVAYASALPGNADVTYDINTDADIAVRVNGAIVLNAALGYNGTITATITVTQDGGGDSAEFELRLVTSPPLMVRREGAAEAATRFDVNTPVNSAVAVLTLAVSGGSGNYQYTPSALPADVNLVTNTGGRIIVSLSGDGLADGETAGFTIAVSDGSGAAEGMATVTVNLRGGIVALLLDARGDVIGDTLGNAPEIYTDESETAAASAESPLVLATLTASGGDGAFSYEMQGVTGLSLTLSLAGDVAVLQAIGTIPNLARNEPRPNVTLRISDGSGLTAAMTVQFNSELPLLNWNTPIFNHVLMSANGQFLSYGDDSGAHQNELWLRGLPGEWLVLLRGGGYSARINDAAAAHNGAFYIIGGRDSSGDLLNDVWASNGAERWRPVLADNAAPAADQFSQREGHAAVSFGGALLVVGHDDVWSSDDNGQTWRQRATPGFDFDTGDVVRVAARRGTLYALGYTAAGEGELWRATDADSWSRVSRPGLLNPRRADMAFTALDDRLYIIGGEAEGATLADVWSSSDGIRWLRETENGAFLSRAGHAAGAYRNRLYVSGGKAGSADYGVWTSYDGVSWAASPNTPEAAAMTAVLLSAHVTTFAGVTLTTYEYGGDAGPFTLPVLAAQTGTVAYASALPGNTDVTYNINAAGADIAARADGAVVINAALGYNATVVATISVAQDGGGDSVAFEMTLVTPPPVMVRREGAAEAATRFDVNTAVDSAVAVVTLRVSGGDGNYQYTPDAPPADVNFFAGADERIIISLSGDGLADGETAALSFVVSDGSGMEGGAATITVNLRGGVVAALLDTRGEVIGDTLGGAPEIYTEESETAAAAPESPFVLATLTASGGSGVFSYAIAGVTELSLTLAPAANAAALQAVGTIPNLALNEPRPNITLLVSDGGGLAVTMTLRFNSELPRLNWNAPIFDHVMVSANGEFISYGDDSGAYRNETWLRGLPGEWLVLLRGGDYGARVNDAAAAHNGVLYVIGGRDGAGNLLNDVWSSFGGAQWRRVLADNGAPAADQFSRREGHAAVSFGGALLVVGHDDVWSSEDNGQTWRERAAPGFDFDENGAVKVAALGGALYALGYTSAGEGEVWRATNADSWSRVSRPGALTSRRADMAFTALGNRLYVIGGAADGGAFLADVWSSADGARWLRETESGAFLARAGHAAGAYRNRLYVSGGKAGSADYGVWTSYDGVSWAAAPNTPAAAAMTAVLLSARVTTFGGATLTTYEYGGDAGPFTLSLSPTQTGTLAYASALPGNVGNVYEINMPGADISINADGAIVLNALLGYSGTVTATITARADGGAAAEFELKLITPPPARARDADALHDATSFVFSDIADGRGAAYTLQLREGGGVYEYTLPASLPANVHLITSVAGRFIVSLSGGGLSAGDNFVFPLTVGSRNAPGAAVLTIDLRGIARPAANAITLNHGILVSINNKLYAYGAHGNQQPDARGTYDWDAYVWSSADGHAWTLETNAAPFALGQDIRHGAGVALNNTMYFMGGYARRSAGGVIQTLASGEVWASEDGREWTLKANGGASFPPRFQFAAGVFNDRLVVAGGHDGGDTLADVWSSADGAVWTRESAAAFAGGRRLAGLATITAADGAPRLLLIGGESGGGLTAGAPFAPTSEVWSSADMRSWTRLTADFGARADFALAQHDGFVYMIGGRFRADSESAAVYRTSDGESWTLTGGGAMPPMRFGGRHGFAAAAYDGRIFIIGDGGDDNFSDINAAIDTDEQEAWSSRNGMNWARAPSLPLAIELLHGAASPLTATVTGDSAPVILATARAFGAAAPYRYAIYGAPPAGVVIGADSGVLSIETPVTVSRDFVVTLSAENAAGAGYFILTARAEVYAGVAGFDAAYSRNGTIFILGSSGDSSFNTRRDDVWTSANGYEWTLRTLSAHGDSVRSRYGIDRAIAELNGTLYAAGGYINGAEASAVYRSADGVSWSVAAEHPGFSARRDALMLQLGGTLYVLSGVGGGVPRDDIWASTDGVNWRLAQGDSPFGSADIGAAGMAGAVLGGVMYVYGGGGGGRVGGAQNLAENWVLYRSGSGANWSESNHGRYNLFGARAYSSMAELNGTLYITGGRKEGDESGASANEVWASSNPVSAASWRLLTGGAPFAGVRNVALFVHGGRLHAGGGVNRNRSAFPSGGAALYSSYDGVSWTSVADAAPPVLKVSVVGAAEALPQDLTVSTGAPAADAAVLTVRIGDDSGGGYTYALDAGGSGIYVTASGAGARAATVRVPAGIGGGASYNVTLTVRNELGAAQVFEFVVNVAGGSTGAAELPAAPRREEPPRHSAGTAAAAERNTPPAGGG